MRVHVLSAVFLFAMPVWAQEPAAPAAAPAVTPAPPDPIATMVGRLDLDRYKATIKGLTQFGDRRQGTDRNRAAIDWIEAQLKSYGCTNTERIHYEYAPPTGGGGRGGGRGNPAQSIRDARTGRRPQARRASAGIGEQRSLETARSPAPRTQYAAFRSRAARRGLLHQDRRHASGRDVHRRRSYGRHRLGRSGQRRWLGHRAGDGARAVLSSPDVQTERSIRFALWNNEETGTNGARAYVTQRKDLQGKESPAGSGKYPEPKWLGMIQHDMMMFDHGMPHKDGTMSKEQRPEADVNIEYQITSKFAEAGRAAGCANFSSPMRSTRPIIRPTSVRTCPIPIPDRFRIWCRRSVCAKASAARRSATAGIPTITSRPTCSRTFTDDDFRLGLNAAQTTLGAVSQLTGARLDPVTSTRGNSIRNASHPAGIREARRRGLHAGLVAARLVPRSFPAHLLAAGNRACSGCTLQPCCFRSFWETFSTSPQTRSRLPLHSLPICSSV